MNPFSVAATSWSPFFATVALPGVTMMENALAALDPAHGVSRSFAPVTSVAGPLANTRMSETAVERKNAAACLTPFASTPRP